MSPWSIEALKEYMDRRFQTLTEAIETASKALDYRLHDMNQWKAKLDDERRDYLDLDTYEARHSLLEQRIQSLDEKIDVRLAKLERWQAKLLGAMGFVLIIVPLLTAITVFYITNHRVP